MNRNLLRCLLALCILVTGWSISKADGSAIAAAPPFLKPFPGAEDTFYIQSTPYLPGILWTGTRYSLDNGLTWSGLAKKPWTALGRADSAMIIVPRPNMENTPRVIVGVQTTDPTQPQLYRSGDFGGTWASVTLPPLPIECNEATFSEVYSIVESPVDLGRLYLQYSCYIYKEIWDYEYYKPLDYFYTSSDAGYTWSRLTAETIQPTNDLSMYVFYNLIASPVVSGRLYLTFDNKLLQSDDFGQNWTSKDLPTEGLNNCKVSLDWFNPDQIYCDDIPFPWDMANTENIFRSDDGGTTWTTIKRPTLGTPLAECGPIREDIKDPGGLYIQCWDDKSLYDEFKISHDGGETWSTQGEWSDGVLSPDLGHPGRLLRSRINGLWESNDQGITWERLNIGIYTASTTPWENVSLPESDNTILLKPLDNQVLMLSTSSYSIESSPVVAYLFDGSSWQKLDAFVPFPPIDADFQSIDDGWLLGKGKSGTGTKIGRWENQQVTNTYTVSELLSHISVADGQAWAAGRKDTDSTIGTILHWDGTGWKEVFTLEGSEIQGIDMVSAEEGWAFGRYGELIRWHDQTWSLFNKLPGTKINALQMLAPNDGWFVGHNTQRSVIYHWDGTDWKAVSHPTSASLTSLFFSGPYSGWAHWGGSNPLHWNGKTWSTVQGCPEFDELFELPSGDLWFWFRWPEERIFRYTESELFLPTINSN